MPSLNVDNFAESVRRMDHHDGTLEALSRGARVDVAPPATEVDKYVRLLLSKWRPTHAQEAAVDLVAGQYKEDVPFVGGFLRNGVALQFVRFDRTLIALQLIVRVANPMYINQGSHSVCGPASFVQGVARSNPVGYVRYVIDLAEKGRGSIGASGLGPALEVEVSQRSALRHKSPKGKDRIHVDIPQADFIAVSSLRNSKNIFGHGRNLSGWAFGGTTNAALLKWMQEAGYRNVEDHSHMYNPAWTWGVAGEARVRNNLLTALQRLRSDPPYTVIISGARGGDLGSNALRGENSDQKWYMRVFGGHFMLLRDVRYDGQGVTLDLMTWGTDTTHPNVHRIPWEAFRKMYRGFVCGQP